MKLSHPFGPEATVNSVLMNCPLEIITGTHPHLAQEALGYMTDLVASLNYYSSTSEIHTLNTTKKNTWNPVSADLWDLLTLALDLETHTEGLFSILFEGIRKFPNEHHEIKLKLPNLVKLAPHSEINLGGIGKGFVLDKTASWLERQSEYVYLINSGGDIRASSSSYPWKVGLVNPIHPEQSFGSVEIKKGALVTSGTYARKREVNGKLHSHFYNPMQKTFIKSPPYLSVTAQGPSAAIAEVWAKCILMGLETPPPSDYRFITVNSNTHAIHTMNASYFGPISRPH